ncbi:MAG: ATP-dependent Clp protease proteolytic subunit [Pseudomonadota bacterium]|nr:ATP-dependent Clp protease proteolytic subunit [Pseudomonadota bacterium]
MADIGAEILQRYSEQKLLASRALFISEGIDAKVARRVISDLLVLDREASDPITVYINSPGGEINSGFAIFDVMRYINSTVRIINAGLCASIATIINVAASKENRFALPNSQFLIHQPLIMGHVEGQASDLEITAREILKTREKINRLLSEECGQALERVSEDTIRDYWMNAEEALAYGLVSKIISSKDELK